MNDYGYKIWCGDYDIAKIVSDRLIKSGFGWYSTGTREPESLKDLAYICIYFGGSVPPCTSRCISYSTNVSFFNKDDATEVRFNDLTTNFLKAVIKHERGI